MHSEPGVNERIPHFSNSHFGFTFRPVGYTCNGHILRCRFGIPGAFPGVAERQLGIMISVWMPFWPLDIPGKALSTAIGLKRENPERAAPPMESADKVRARILKALEEHKGAGPKPPGPGNGPRHPLAGDETSGDRMVK